jgi:hypothetical protein
VKRWSEEARVLDGENVIECADVTRPFILPDLEESRDKILKEMKKDNPEGAAVAMKSTLAGGSLQLGRRSYRPAGLSASADGLSQRLASDNPTPQEAAARNSILEDLARIQESVALQAGAVAALGQAVADSVARDMEQSDSENSDDYSSHLSEDTDGDLQDAVIDMVRNRAPVTDPMDLAEATDNASLGSSLMVATSGSAEQPTGSALLEPIGQEAAATRPSLGGDIPVPLATLEAGTQAASSSNAPTNSSGMYPFFLLQNFFWRGFFSFDGILLYLFFTKVI